MDEFGCDVRTNDEPGAPTINAQIALKRLGGDKVLLHELAALYQVDGPRLLTLLKESLSNGKSAESIRIAHTLRGLAANFEARGLMEAALRVEQLTLSGQLDEGMAALLLVTTHHQELLAALKAL